MTKLYLPTTKVAVFVALFSILIWWFAFGDEDSYLKEANMKVRWLSWFIPLETVQAHSLLFEASECYEWENGCFSDIQNFTQNWYDLDLFFVDNKWNVWHHTIMDRNMGATEVYNKKFWLWNINTWSFGYRYQWWNNYWFKPCYTNWCSDFLEETYTPGIPYHVRDYVYNEGLDWNNPIHFFSQNVWSDWYSVFDSEVESQTAETIKPPQSIRDKQWKNLRWWVWDTCDDEWNCSEWDWRIVYHYNTTEYTIENWNSVPHATEATKIREKTRQWPCPDEYHVPSAKEWDEILLWWAYGKNKQVSSTYSHYFEWNNAWKELSSDLLLPPAWFRKAIESIYSWDRQWDIGTYRSSTPIEQNQNGGLYHGDSSAKRFEFDSDYIHNGATISHSSSVTQEGVPVRCVKNTADSKLNVYPNGWTNAFISIYKGKIIALWTPKRAWYTFEWWYRNEDFTGKKVEEWENVDSRREQVWIGQTSIPHLDLYAKRKANPKCTDLPANATANNYNTPTSDTKYYYSTNKSLTCTFQCNPNYTWNSTTSKCVPNECQWTLPANATLWNPSIVPSNNTTSYSYSATSTPEACKFKCNTNYTWNSSTSSCVNNTPSTYQCIGTLPANSTRNNNLIPDKNTNYYYSTDIYLACSFHCNTNYTWNSSTSTCETTTKTYTLTINYLYSDWWTASSSITRILSAWDSYSITSPTISNYNASTSVVKWTMPSSDRTIDVVYTKKVSSGWWSSSSSSDSYSNDLSIRLWDSNPYTDERIKLIIDVNKKYTWKVYFPKLQYYNTSSSKRTNINTSSTSYISDYCDDLDIGYVKFTSSDDWRITISRFIKFAKAGKYRIYAEDKDWDDYYIQFTVDWDNSSSDNYNTEDSNISLSVSNSQPKTYKPIDVTLKTDNYVGKIKLYAKYKDSSNSRVKISNNSSYEYFSDYSNIWENWYYKMISSDKWKKTLYGLIEFKKEWSYRIYAEDEQWYSNYTSIDVNSSTNTTTKTNTWDDIDKLINQLLWTDTTTTENNKNIDDGIERNKKNLKDISDEIYKSRSCKEYRIQYDSTLWAFTSPDLQKKEYFINKEYFKRYIDSKNPQKEWCPTNAWWISTSYKDSSTSSTHVITPNWKVYFISTGNWSYYSNNLTTNKSFASLIEIKNFIKNRNPLIIMTKTK